MVLGCRAWSNRENATRANEEEEKNEPRKGRKEQKYEENEKGKMRRREDDPCGRMNFAFLRSQRNASHAIYKRDRCASRLSRSWETDLLMNDITSRIAIIVTVIFQSRRCRYTSLSRNFIISRRAENGRVTQGGEMKIEKSHEDTKNAHVFLWLSPIIDQKPIRYCDRVLRFIESLSWARRSALSPQHFRGFLQVHVSHDSLPFACLRDATFPFSVL